MAAALYRLRQRVDDGTPSFSAASGVVAFGSDQVDMACTGASVGGTIRAGANATGDAIASVTTAGVSGCVGPLGLPLTFRTATPWTVNATGTATAGSSDTVAVTVTGVSILVFQTGSPASCTFTISGTMDGTIREADQRLDLTVPNAGAALRISGVTGCYGLWREGDMATLEATFGLTSPAGALELS